MEAVVSVVELPRSSAFLGVSCRAEYGDEKAIREDGREDGEMEDGEEVRGEDCFSGVVRLGVRDDDPFVSCVTLPYLAGDDPASCRGI